VEKLRDYSYPFVEEKSESTKETNSNDRNSNIGYTHYLLYFVFEVIRELLIKNNLEDILIVNSYYKKY
jgi:hypothetical protein